MTGLVALSGGPAQQSSARSDSPPLFSLPAYRLTPPRFAPREIVKAGVSLSVKSVCQVFVCRVCLSSLCLKARHRGTCAQHACALHTDRGAIYLHTARCASEALARACTQQGAPPRPLLLTLMHRVISKARLIRGPCA
jgi:hypothetical protein